METFIFVGFFLSVLLLVLIFVFPKKTNQDEQDNQLFIPATKAYPLYNMEMELKMIDNGGTRLGIDRRKFQYTAFVPEQRSGMDRRKGFDRRSRIARKRGSERRVSLNHRGPYPIERRDAFRANLK